MNPSIFQQKEAVTFNSNHTEFSDEFLEASVKHKNYIPEIPNAFLKDCITHEFIIPIFDKTHSSCGCGFFAGDLFFTCGHVLSAPEIYVVVDSQFIPLFKKHQIIERNDNDTTGYDVAIYKIGGLKSDLTFYTGSVDTGKLLESVSLRKKGNDTETVYCTATVLNDDMRDGNYFGIETSLSLKEGCSGSPVFYNNKVVGIITMGNNNGDDTRRNKTWPLNTCFLLSSQAILRLLDSIS